jgi:hypothetical protein
MSTSIAITVAALILIAAVVVGTLLRVRGTRIQNKWITYVILGCSAVYLAYFVWSSTPR